MFQFAFSVALTHSQDSPVLCDFGGLGTEQTFLPPGGSKLEIYRIVPQWANPAQVRECLLSGGDWRNRLYQVWRNLLKKRNKRSASIVTEPCSGVFYPEYLQLTGSRYYRGYFQTEKYFSAHRDEILQNFTLKNPLSGVNAEFLCQIRACDAVSLHVRRGDYLQLSGRFPVCPPEYYRRAAGIIAEHIKKPVFFVFSDDLQWARENLNIGYQCVYVDANSSATAYADLELMRHCRHHIIANSSFSWWGAWLNPHPDKIVIAPRQWLVGEKNAENMDTVPNNWIKI